MHREMKPQRRMQLEIIHNSFHHCMSSGKQQSHMNYASRQVVRKIDRHNGLRGKEQRIVATIR